MPTKQTIISTGARLFILIVIDVNDILDNSMKKVFFSHILCPIYNNILFHYINHLELILNTYENGGHKKNVHCCIYEQKRLRWGCTAQSHLSLCYTKTQTGHAYWRKSGLKRKLSCHQVNHSVDQLIINMVGHLFSTVTPQKNIKHLISATPFSYNNLTFQHESHISHFLKILHFFVYVFFQARATNILS